MNHLSGNCRYVACSSANQPTSQTNQIHSATNKSHNRIKFQIKDRLLTLWRYGMVWIGKNEIKINELCLPWRQIKIYFLEVWQTFFPQRWITGDGIVGYCS